MLLREYAEAADEPSPSGEVGGGAARLTKASSHFKGIVSSSLAFRLERLAKDNRVSEPTTEKPAQRRRADIRMFCSAAYVFEERVLGNPENNPDIYAKFG